MHCRGTWEYGADFVGILLASDWWPLNKACEYELFSLGEKTVQYERGECATIQSAAADRFSTVTVGGGSNRSSSPRVVLACTDKYGAAEPCAQSACDVRLSIVTDHNRVFGRTIHARKRRFKEPRRRFP